MIHILREIKIEVLPPGNFLVCLHLEVQRVALNPFSQSKVTTLRLRQWMQPSELGFEHLQ